MAGDFVNEQQAASMGGGGKPAGAQAEQTFQDNKIKQLVVMVRFKPAPAGFDTGAASSMLDGVTGAIDKTVGAVEGAMASIPGLDLFIKEEKKESQSEKVYHFFEDYAGWDKVFKKAEEGLKELNAENAVETFEFDAKDIEGRQKAARELFDKVKGKIASWSGYTAALHFLGLGQGGNVANECTDLLAKDDQFQKEKWFVRSVIHIGTPACIGTHEPNQGALKEQGKVISLGNKYDLTQFCTGYFDKNEQLLKLISDTNSNLLSLATGQVKLRIIQILAIVLSGLHLAPGKLDELEKFGKIREEVEGLIRDVISLVKKLIDEGTSFVDLNEIPEFAKVTKGYDTIPSDAADRLSRFLDELKKSAGEQAKKANVSLSPSDLAGALNCLCPLFDRLADTLGVFKPGSAASNKLAGQILEKAGVSRVLKPATAVVKHLAVDSEYENKAKSATEVGQPESGLAYVRTVHSLIAKATQRQQEVSKMNEEEKAFLAEAISTMIAPMLASKKDLYGRLLKLIPFDLVKLMERLSAEKLMSFPGGGLEKLNIQFPAELTASIARADAELKRIRGYLDNRSFALREDTLYFVYNSHNLTLKKMYGPIANCLDEQTGYLEYMKARGLLNEVSLGENLYKQGTSEPKNNVLPAKELSATP